jgi:CheY-like chemotaxis protein
MTLDSLSEIRVLVVEDNQFMRTFLVDELKAINVDSVEAANSGNRALDVEASIRFDLIIIDLEIENGNGIELIERIQKGCYIEGPLAPISVLSANTTRSMNCPLAMRG